MIISLPHKIIARVAVLAASALLFAGPAAAASLDINEFSVASAADELDPQGITN